MRTESALVSWQDGDGQDRSAWGRRHSGQVSDQVNSRHPDATQLDRALLRPCFDGEGRCSLTVVFHAPKRSRERNPFAMGIAVRHRRRLPWAGSGNMFHKNVGLHNIAR